ncbi:hypothetical protein TELCIR_22537 [Teladorsagia circumcincta]|uniref:Uncharacterized protein n=1 Tax=Teladorsagia circumcincta TaxID=45464 RepID=A0A2G9TDW3_TELCI|nr:hypothetical protein TELCIR_22537 [Teladorsagia circumcincta]
MGSRARGGIQSIEKCGIRRQGVFEYLQEGFSDCEQKMAGGGWCYCEGRRSCFYCGICQLLRRGTGSFQGSSGVGTFAQVILFTLQFYPVILL